MRKSKWLFVMEPLSWMLLFRNNESSQNGCQVVLPRIVLSDHFCSFGQMTSFILSMQSLTLHCDPLWICAHLYLHLRSSTYTWAHHCRSPMCISVLHNKTELNRSASTKTADARNERKNQAEINQLLQVQSTNHLVARFRVVNIYSRASFLVVPLFK